MGQIGDRFAFDPLGNTKNEKADLSVGSVISGAGGGGRPLQAPAVSLSVFAARLMFDRL
jgi:hypothetical protein